MTKSIGFALQEKAGYYFVIKFHLTFGNTFYKQMKRTMREIFTHGGFINMASSIRQ